MRIKILDGISATFGRVDNKGAMSSGVSGTGAIRVSFRCDVTERPVICIIASELMANMPTMWT